MFHPPSLSQGGESPKDVYKCFASPGCLCPTGPFSPLSCKTITTQPFWHLTPCHFECWSMFSIFRIFCCNFLSRSSVHLKEHLSRWMFFEMNWTFSRWHKEEKMQREVDLWNHLQSCTFCFGQFSNIYLHLSFSLRYYDCKKRIRSEMEVALRYKLLVHCSRCFNLII